MSLLTGPGMRPLMYGDGAIGTVTNGDKLLYNNMKNRVYGDASKYNDRSNLLQDMVQ